MSRRSITKHLVTHKKWVILGLTVIGVVSTFAYYLSVNSVSYTYKAKIVGIQYANNSMVDGCDDLITLDNGREIGTKCFWTGSEDIIGKFDLSVGDTVKVQEITGSNYTNTEIVGKYKKYILF